MPSNDNFRTCICKHITPLDTCRPIAKHFETFLRLSLINKLPMFVPFPSFSAISQISMLKKGMFFKKNEVRFSNNSKQLRAAQNYF